jgi:hypothetical protein
MKTVGTLEVGQFWTFLPHQTIEVDRKVALTNAATDKVEILDADETYWWPNPTTFLVVWTEQA